MVKETRKINHWTALKIFAAFAGALIFGILILIAGLMVGAIPDSVPQSHEVSPDRRMRVSIDEEAYGTFGPVLYVVRIGPDSELLNWALRKKVIEIDAADVRVPAPTATWIDSHSVAIALPVKPDKLAAAIRDGLYPHPAADRYGSVRIAYKAR